MSVTGRHGQSRRRFFVAMASLGLALFACPSVLALNPTLDVSQYAHTAWRVRDGGLPDLITAIAQTLDGYLWLGTNDGLFRFDGDRSVRWQPPPGQTLPSPTVTGLMTGRDGTLWIGTRLGLVSWKDGTFAHYPDVGAVPIGKMLETHDGAMWLTVAKSVWILCSLQGGRATCSGEDGGPGAGAIGVYENSHGTIWVGTADGVWRWRPGPPRFFRLPHQPDPISSFAESSDGALLIPSVGGLRQLRDDRVELAYAFPAAIEGALVDRVLRDRDGGIWIGTTAAGLVHVHQGITDVFGEDEGLSGDSVSQLFEDREGTIWVVTLDGLDRFRELAAAPFTTRQGLSSSRVVSMSAARDGSVWVATRGGLNRLSGTEIAMYGASTTAARRQPDRPTSRTVHEVTGPRMPSPFLSSIFEDRRQRLWVATLAGVGYLERDRFVQARGVPGGIIRAIVEDRRGVWFANTVDGLYRLSDDASLSQHVPWNAVGPSGPASAVAADSSTDGLWLGFGSGGVINFADGQRRASYAETDGLAPGYVRGLRLERDGTLWVAADGGFSRVKDGRVLTLTRKDGLPCDSTQWVASDDRTVWLGMTCGVVRIARPDLETWASASAAGPRPNSALKLAMFGVAEGVRITPDGAYYTAAADVDATGRLWFVTGSNVNMIDPQHLPFNTLPPPVHIEQMTADRNAYDTTPNATRMLRLPPRTRDLRIDYTALSLVAPEKLQFRYKLEGFDADWQNAGNRRQAFYTNLPPRDYRFRVIASNNDGVWNEEGATLAFTIAPAYYQTTWFLVLSVGLVVASGWAAYRLRLHFARRHEREISALNERLMKAQEQERMRIAGELHDGVMQEMVAATMMLGTAKRRAADGGDAAGAIDKVQQKLVQVGHDIRQLSHDLHPPMLQQTGLPRAVETYCEQFATSSGIPVVCEADDEVRDLSRGTALAIYRILQEALGNTLKHAKAKRVRVRLTRSADDVVLTVEDDGVGFDANRLGPTGGLGLITMRERASQLNGTFEFSSAPGRGTAIRVVIPFR